jgi:hypothetical protein
MKKLILSTALAATMGGAAFVPLQAMADTIIVRMAPPAPRHEVVPPPRHGYAWVPGYWNWNGHRYVWSRGHWERERVGYVYHQPEWVQDGRRWRFNRGGWMHGERADRVMHDRDGDGVPNRADRDRDGDGVPNRVDDRPNNPYRQ